MVEGRKERMKHVGSGIKWNQRKIPRWTKKKNFGGRREKGKSKNIPRWVSFSSTTVTERSCPFHIVRTHTKFVLHMTTKVIIIGTFSSFIISSFFVGEKGTFQRKRNKFPTTVKASNFVPMIFLGFSGSYV